ncbi:MAG: hypothetical protein KAT68_07515 [Bacteroidales bacterium]|nr:hypothetical protein [Bacteroidales bacterium]
MKTTKKICIFYFFFFGLLSCNSQNKEAESYEGYPLKVTDDYKKVKVEEFSNNMETFYIYYLKKPKVIQSYPCKGRFRIGTDSLIYGFTLSEDHVINGTLIPKGSNYERNSEDFYMIHLSKDITIQGFPVYHKETGLFQENNVNFHNDGTMTGFHLADDMIIGNIPCKGGKKNNYVMLYHAGDIRYCNLAENMEINGIPCQGGEENSTLWLYPDGQIISCILSKDFKIDDKLYNQGTRLIFDNEGKVHFLSGQLDYVYFYDVGGVLNCVLKNDLEIKGKLIGKKSRLIFNKNGSLKKLRPSHHIVIDGIPCKKKRFMEFYPNEKIKWCILSEDFEMNGITYKKGTQLNFDENGMVL